MTGRVAFAYAQARVQARYARLAGPADWTRLERVSDFGQFVQLAQGMELKPWLAHVGPDSGPHEIELALRHRFRGHVSRVAAWLPGPWRPATEWLAVLVDLPAVARLLSGRPALPWMRHDPLYRKLADLPAAERRAAFARTPLAPLAAEGGDPREIAARWQEHWRGLRPSASASACRGLDRIADHLVAVLPEPGEARLMGRVIRGELRRPAAVHAYLGLARREMDRLRGMLVRRRMLPGTTSRAA